MEPKETQFRATPETPEEHQEHPEQKSPEEERMESLILDVQNFRFSWGENRARYRGAKQEISNLGELGVDLIVQALKKQRISPYCALELLEDSPSEKSIPALESLLVSDIVLNDVDRSVIYQLLMRLPEKDRSSSIPAIVGLAEHRLAKVNKVLGEKNVTIEQLKDQQFLLILDDIQKAVEGLQKFTDREGFNQAERLYEEFNQIKGRVNEIRASERVRLKELLDKPYEVNFESFPGASPGEAEQINKVIGEIQNSQNWWDQSINLGNFGEPAVPFIYQAIKEGRLSGQKAWRTLAQYPAEKILPIYHGLLLECAQPNVIFFQQDILTILKNLRSPESVRIIAEFIRKSAELCLNIEDEEKRFTLENNVLTGTQILYQFDTPEAERLRKLLSFSYPELSVGYEVVSLPRLEKPTTKEQREWAHTKMYVRGSALFAKILGRGKEKVHDVDVFITNSDYYAAEESMKVGYLENLDDLENILSREELLKLKTWIDQNGYTGKPINLVRIPESHLVLEETFEGEPKLLLWDQVLEGEVEVGRYTTGDLQSYKEGERVINPQFPERLTPNGTLTRALRLMDLAERFGLEYDPMILVQAEQAARNSKLVISSFPTNRLINIHELSATALIDPTFIKVFRDKKLRKSLIRKFPRLGQIAEEIVSMGGVDGYIKEKYGEVYLHTKGYVRLYDINLTKSTASTERQRQFIQEWHAELGQKDFSLTDVKKVEGKPKLPKPEGLGHLVDSGKMRKAVEKRKDKKQFLEKAIGNYKLVLENKDPQNLKRKIELFLATMNLEWPANLEMDKKKVSQTLIRLGVHPKNPILSQFDSTKRHEVELAISDDALDILQASTDKPWHSCVDLNEGAYRDGLYEDVASASVIAYVLKNEKFLSRVIIRVGFTLDKFEPAVAIEKLYGDSRYQKAMHDAIKTIVNGQGVKVDEPMLTYPFQDAYFDSSSGDTLQGNRFYYTKQTYRSSYGDDD